MRLRKPMPYFGKWLKQNGTIYKQHRASCENQMVLKVTGLVLLILKIQFHNAPLHSK